MSGVGLMRLRGLWGSRDDDDPVKIDRYKSRRSLTNSTISADPAAQPRVHFKLKNIQYSYPSGFVNSKMEPERPIMSYAKLSNIQATNSSDYRAFDDSGRSSLADLYVSALNLSTTTTLIHPQHNKHLSGYYLVELEFGVPVELRRTLPLSTFVSLDSPDLPREGTAYLEHLHIQPPTYRLMFLVGTNQAALKTMQKSIKAKKYFQWAVPNSVVDGARMINAFSPWLTTGMVIPIHANAETKAFTDEQISEKLRYGERIDGVAWRRSDRVREGSQYAAPMSPAVTWVAFFEELLSKRRVIEDTLAMAMPLASRFHPLLDMRENPRVKATDYPVHVSLLQVLQSDVVFPVWADTTSMRVVNNLFMRGKDSVDFSGMPSLNSIQGELAKKLGLRRLIHGSSLYSVTSESASFQRPHLEKEGRVMTPLAQLPIPGASMYSGAAHGATIMDYCWALHTWDSYAMGLKVL